MDTDTFFTAYSLVWFAVLVYVGRLGAHQRKLNKAISALEARLEQAEASDDTSSNIAA